MSSDLATFMLSNIIRPPSSRHSTRSGRAFSGAAISGPCLVIATEEAVGFRELRLCEDRTRYFLLEGRGQRSVRRFAAELHAFVRKHHLRHALLRGSPGSGKYTAAPTTYMIEGVLNLVPGLHLEIVAAQTVSAWVRHEGSIAPCCPGDAPRRLRDAFTIAIQSACLGETLARPQQHGARGGEDCL